MRIVNVRGIKPGTEGITYCGRAWAGWEASPLGNPCIKNYKCKVCKQTHLTAPETITCYRYWLVNNVVQENPVIIEAMLSLNEESILGCWCVPNPCHCEVIIETWEKFFKCSTPKN